MRSKVWGVGFHEQPVNGNRRGDGSKFVVLTVGQHSGERNVQAESDTDFGSRCIAAEGVHDSGELPVTGFGLQHLHDLGFGLPAMDDERLLQLPRQLNVSDEILPLNVERREVPILVEPRFADADDMRMRREVGDPFEVTGLRFVSIVRLDSDNRRHARIAVRQHDRRLTRLQCHTDRQHAFNAAVQGSLNRRVNVLMKGLGVEMTVRVNQATGRVSMLSRRLIAHDQGCLRDCEDRWGEFWSFSRRTTTTIGLVASLPAGLRHREQCVRNDHSAPDQCQASQQIRPDVDQRTPKSVLMQQFNGLKCKR